MAGMDKSEVWRQVPPEEKLNLIAKAHSSGVISAVAMILIGSTLAVGFQYGPLFWGTLLLSPLAFQTAAAKSWRHLKPRTMLEYLAARAAARRYAFTNKARDLGVVLMFRGAIRENFDKTNDDISEALDAMEALETVNRGSSMWVALLSDSIVVMAEDAGGASLALGHLLDKSIEIKGEGTSEYSNDRSVKIILKDAKGSERTFTLTSDYPAALIAFEKRSQALQKICIAKREEEERMLGDRRLREAQALEDALV